MHILICDDQDIIARGLKLILQSQPDFEVSTVSDGAMAVEHVREKQPDIVLMDLNMPVMNGIKATQAIKQHHPEVKVLILTTHGDDEWLFDAIRCGADGYLLKDIPYERLLSAIRSTVAGETHIDPKIARKVFDQVAQRTPAPDSQFLKKLTNREIEILTLISRGLTNTEIAESIHLTEGTVRNYISALFSKIDVSDRTQAALLGLRYGLTDINDL
ncbi:MAG: response regulator transcription factor [Chloroflexota bacterium]